MEAIGIVGPCRIILFAALRGNPGDEQGSRFVQDVYGKQRYIFTISCQDISIDLAEGDPLEGRVFFCKGRT